MSLDTTSLINSSVLLYCPVSTATLINNSYNITRICLLLPLSILILHLGYRRWRQQRSFKTMSHSDVFTYHNAALVFTGNLGSIIYLCGFYFDLLYVKYTGYWFFHLTFSGEAFFHLLTCIERYLAVIHPIMYMGLRNSRGVMIRNISIGCAWLLSFVWSTIATINLQAFPIVQVFCLLLFSIVIVSFCSLSVLWVLIHPGPGNGGRTRERADQSKQRAFFTIMAITAVLYFWFVGLLVCFAVGLLPLFCRDFMWVLRTSGFWFSLPSSLVLPLLYLHRTGKLSYCQNSRQRK